MPAVHRLVRSLQALPPHNNLSPVLGWCRGRGPGGPDAESRYLVYASATSSLAEQLHVAAAARLAKSQNEDPMKQGLPMVLVADVATQLATALAALHGAGWHHLQLEPACVLLEPAATPAPGSLDDESTDKAPRLEWTVKLAGYGALGPHLTPDEGSATRASACAGRLRAPEWFHVARREGFEREARSVRSRLEANEAAIRSVTSAQLDLCDKDGAQREAGVIVANQAWEAGKASVSAGGEWQEGFDRWQATETIRRNHELEMQALKARLPGEPPFHMHVHFPLVSSPCSVVRLLIPSKRRTIRPQFPPPRTIFLAGLDKKVQRLQKWGDIGAQADVFAFGVLLAEMMTGCATTPAETSTNTSSGSGEVEPVAERESGSADASESLRQLTDEAGMAGAGDDEADAELILRGRRPPLPVGCPPLLNLVTRACWEPEPSKVRSVAAIDSTPPSVVRTI